MFLRSLRHNSSLFSTIIALLRRFKCRVLMLMYAAVIGFVDHPLGFLVTMLLVVESTVVAVELSLAVFDPAYFFHF